MVISSDFRVGQHRDDDHEEDAPYFIKSRFEIHQLDEFFTNLSKNQNRSCCPELKFESINDLKPLCREEQFCDPDPNWPILINQHLAGEMESLFRNFFLINIFLNVFQNTSNKYFERFFKNRQKIFLYIFYKKFNRLKPKTPTCMRILLLGPPGSSKTLTVKKVAKLLGWLKHTIAPEVPKNF